MGKEGRDSKDDGEPKPRIKGAGIRSALRRTSANPHDPNDFSDPYTLKKPPPPPEYGQLPRELVKKCREAADAEAAKLPTDASSERMARRRLSRSQSEVLLKQGLSLQDVAKSAALRVLEAWLPVLRPFASREELPHLIAAIVHGESEVVTDDEDSESEEAELEADDVSEELPPVKGASMTKCHSFSDVLSGSRTALEELPTHSRKQQHAATVGFGAGTLKAPIKEERRRWPNLKLPEELDEHPVPPPGDLIGFALRQVVPLPTELRRRWRREERRKKMRRPVSPAWEFLTDIIQVQEMEVSLGRDASWPFTEERKALNRTSGVKVKKEFAECFALKNREKYAGNHRRAPLPAKLAFRLSDTGQSWSNFRGDSGMRHTFVGFCPQVYNANPESDPKEVPGPCFYKPRTPVYGGRLTSTRGRFDSVGKPRVALGEASLSQSGRFFFTKGDPRYQDV